MTRPGHGSRGHAVSCRVSRVGLGAIAMVWWKKLKVKPVDEQAKAFIAQHGKEALDAARNAAREARNKGSRKQARHYSLLALQIAEMTEKKPLSPDAEKPR